MSEYVQRKEKGKKSCNLPPGGKVKKAEDACYDEVLVNRHYVVEPS